MTQFEDTKYHITEKGFEMAETIETGNPLLNALVVTQTQVDELTQRVEALENTKVETVSKSSNGYATLEDLAIITGFSEYFLNRHLLWLAKPDTIVDDICMAGTEEETSSLAHEIEPVQLWANKIKNTAKLVEEGSKFYWSPITGKSVFFKIRW